MTLTIHKTSNFDQSYNCILSLRLLWVQTLIQSTIYYACHMATWPHVTTMAQSVD